MDSGGEADRDIKRIICVAAAAWLGSVALGVTLRYMFNSMDAEEAGTTEDVATVSQDAPVQVEHANGCPLDAVAYDAPAFANHDSKALKVVDRTSGASWWLVKMGRSWVALPIEGKEPSSVLSCRGRCKSSARSVTTSASGSTGWYARD